MLFPCLPTLAQPAGGAGPRPFAMGFSYTGIYQLKLQYDKTSQCRFSAALAPLTYLPSTDLAKIADNPNATLQFALPCLNEVDILSHDTAFTPAPLVSLAAVDAPVYTDTDMSKANMTSTMLTGWLNVPINELPVTPYFGFSLGLLTVSYDSALYSQKDPQSLHRELEKVQAAPAWSFGAGAAYHVSDLFTLDFGYRFIKTANNIALEIMDPLDPTLESQFDLKAHDLSLGLRAAF